MHVGHGPAAAPVHAVPSVLVEEHEVHRRAPVDVLVDAVELLDGGARPAARHGSSDLTLTTRAGGTTTRAGRFAEVRLVVEDVRPADARFAAARFVAGLRTGFGAGTGASFGAGLTTVTASLPRAAAPVAAGVVAGALAATGGFAGAMTGALATAFRGAALVTADTLGTTLTAGVDARRRLLDRVDAAKDGRRRAGRNEDRTIPESSYAVNTARTARSVRRGVQVVVPLVVNSCSRA